MKTVEIAESDVCPKEAVLTEYAHGRLDSAVTASVEAHARGCEACRRLLYWIGRDLAYDSTAPLTRSDVQVLVAQPVAPIEDAFRGTERFQIVRQLGAGGMGVVYEVYDRKLDAHVALKALRHAGGAHLLRLKNELRTLADLHHRNLVHFYELIHDAEQWFLTMELVRGRDFLCHVWLAPGAAVVARDDARDDAPLRDALLQLAEGLCALHAAHKVHCDIKPSNVLVEDGGRVVLLDFGLVSDRAGSDGSSGQPGGGTPAYVAPEQAIGLSVGPEADWYSVGVMLFEALTGRLPIDARGPELMRRKQTEMPRAPSVLTPGVPADLDGLCRRLLDIDPRRRPTGPEVCAILRGRAPPPAVDGSAPFVGRTVELAALDAALVEARGGATRVRVVEGESGLGKSALVRQFAERAQLGGACVLASRCYEQESVPYKAVDGIVDALSRALAAATPAELSSLSQVDAALLIRVFPVLAGVRALQTLAHTGAPPIDPVEARQRIGDGLCKLLGMLARHDKVVVMVVDDLHWSDAESQALLRELLEVPSLLLVATARPGVALALPPNTVTLAMHTLPDDDARALARALLGTRAGDPAALATEAGGHPLFMAELARHARGQAGPVTLDDALRARIDTLDDQRALLVQLLSVAGEPVPHEVLAHASRQPPHPCAHNLSVLRRDHFAQTREGVVELYHDRLRVAALGRLDAPARRDCHERLATAMEMHTQADAETMAVHFQAAGLPARAAGHAVRAANQADRAFAFERAARLYRLALELDPARADAHTSRVRLGDALANLGHQREAAAAYLAAVGDEPGADEFELERRAAEQLVMGGDLATGLPRLDAVLAQVGLTRHASAAGALVVALTLRARIRLRGLRYTLTPEAEAPKDKLARIDVCVSAGRGLMGINLTSALEFHSRALLLAFQAGEPTRLATALAAEVGLIAVSGEPGRKRSETLLALASQLAAESGATTAHARVALAEGSLAFHRGRWKECQERLELAERILSNECVGVAQERLITRISLLSARIFRGEFDGLKERLRDGIRDAEARGELYGQIAFRTGYTVLLHLADGDFEEARRQVEQASVLQPPSDKPYLLFHYGPDLYARTTLALYEGKPADALREIVSRWTMLRKTFALHQQWLRVLFWDLRGRAALAAAAADPARARSFVAEARTAVRRLARENTGWATPLATLLRAGPATLDGRADQARALREEAAQGFASLDMALHASIARGDGQWLRAHRVPDRARFARLFSPVDGA